MKLPYDFYKSILIVHKDLNKDIFLQRCGVRRNSFAETTFSRMYDTIMSEIVDLNEEYLKYYAVEYDTIKHYLYTKMNLDEEQIEKVVKFIDDLSYIVWRKEDSASGDYGIETFAFSETLLERVEKILLLA